MPKELKAKSMKFKPGKDIPVGTIVYKKVGIRLEKDSWGGLWAAGNAILTCLVTEPGICPNNKPSTKCRVREVLVLKAETIGGRLLTNTTFYSKYTPEFKYRLGHKARPDMFDDYKYSVCTNGIHVFLSKNHARRFHL